MIEPPRPSASPATLWSIQWMRAAAALLVVIGHAQTAVAADTRLHGMTFARSTVLPWGAGVDLFFVISGFIMVHASRRLFGVRSAPGAFLRRRLGRIVPLYWLATTLYLALLAFASWKGGDPFPPVAAIAASFAFLPHGGSGDGLAFPVLDLGWTLNYEMVFYVLFATVLAIGTTRARSVATLIGVILLLVLLGSVLPRGWVALAFWTRPIIVDFALGLAVALAMAEGAILAPGWRWCLVAGGTALLAADPLSVFAGPAGTTVGNGWLRVAVAGVPAAAVLAGAVLGPKPIAHRRLASLSRLGDASYSLYLIHPFVLIAMGKLVQKSADVRSLPGGVLVAGTVLTAILVALVVHARIEAPILRALAAARSRPRAPRLRLNLPRGAET